MDWTEVDATELFSVIRDQAAPEDGERMVWAFEQVLAGARIDPALLDHLAAACVCALAYRNADTPRGVLELLFRRAVSDDRWREDYAGLLAG